MAAMVARRRLEWWRLAWRPLGTEHAAAAPPEQPELLIEQSRRALNPVHFNTGGSELEEVLAGTQLTA